MNELELKRLEKRAVECLQRAFSDLRDLAVRPERMSVVLGEISTDLGQYVVELRVSLE